MGSAPVGGSGGGDPGRGGVADNEQMAQLAAYSLSMKGGGTAAEAAVVGGALSSGMPAQPGAGQVLLCLVVGTY